MGLGRTTRFARLPEGARRVSVMRAGRAGIKALAPSPELFADFGREKKARLARKVPRPRAHLEAFEAVDYRKRFLAQVRSDPAALAALRAILAEARERDVFLMCMCPYETPGRACHTYLLLELARELDRGARIVKEPKPTSAP